MSQYEIYVFTQHILRLLSISKLTYFSCIPLKSCHYFIYYKKKRRKRLILYFGACGTILDFTKQETIGSILLFILKFIVSNMRMRKKDRVGDTKRKSIPAPANVSFCKQEWCNLFKSFTASSYTTCWRCWLMHSFSCSFLWWQQCTLHMWHRNEAILFTTFFHLV